MARKTLFFLAAVVTSSWGYQESLNCFPCNEGGVYYFRLHCDQNGSAEVEVDDPTQPNTISFTGPAETGIVYATDVTLEDIFKRACGE